MILAKRQKRITHVVLLLLVGVALLLLLLLLRFSVRACSGGDGVLFLAVGIRDSRRVWQQIALPGYARDEAVTIRMWQTAATSCCPSWAQHDLWSRHQLQRSPLPNGFLCVCVRVRVSVFVRGPAVC